MLPDVRSETTAPPAPSVRTTDPAGAGGALLVEGALVALYLTGRLPLPGAIAAHLVVTALLIARCVMRLRNGGDGAASGLLALVVFIAGPFGALGGLLLGRFARPEQSDTERLEAWYDRISMSTELSASTRRTDRILTGRIANLKAGMPKSFAGVLEQGSIKDKQIVLGLIARRFHPDYLPALKLALVSNEPVIRVQAAAVAAKIRVSLAERTEAALTAANDPAMPAEMAMRHLADAEHCVASGLLEGPDTVRATAVINGIIAAAAARIDRGSALREGGAPANLLERYEAHLLATRRYGDFRRLRRALMWRASKGLRFRPLTKRTARRGATS